MGQWPAAFRQLVRNPGFSSAAVLLLGLGIGANTTIFSLVETIFLKPLPYPDPQQIVFVTEASPSKNEKESLVAPARLTDWGRLSQTFQVLSGYYADSETDTTGSLPERLRSLRVAPGYFSVWEARPLLGRTFRASEEQTGGPNAVVISHPFWIRRYAGSAQALGKQLRLGGLSYTVIGVMPSTFGSPTEDLWLPAQFNDYLLKARDARFLIGLGRLKPGVPVASAEADLTRVQRLLGGEYPLTDKGWSALVRNAKDQLVGSHSQFAWLTFGAVALLLALACANIAGLLLSHVYRRQREFAVRASVGGSKWQIASTLLREFSLISLGGFSLGILLSLWGVAAAARLFRDLPRIAELQLDWTSVGFAAALTLLIVLVVGTVPALQASKMQLTETLAQGGRTQAGGRQSWQRALLISQFSLTVVILSSASLLLRTYYGLAHVDSGFSSDHVLTFHVGASWGEDRNQVGRVQTDLLAGLRRRPEVVAAGMTNFLPTDGATLRYQYQVIGLPGSNPASGLTAGSRMVTGDYLKALQVPLLAGRSCPDAPTSLNMAGQAVVNRAFADKFDAGDNLVGHNLRIVGTDVSGSFPIAGIIGDMREDSFRTAPVPYVYVCAAAGGWPDMTYVVRTKAPSASFFKSIRKIVHEIAPSRAVFAADSLDTHVAAALEQPRLTAGILTAFGIAAISVAAFGLYSLFSTLVTTRTREIGTRIALGAQSSHIVAELLKYAGRLLVAGIAAGTALAVLAAAWLQTVLFGVSPFDPRTFLGVAALLCLISLGAIAVPAIRAAAINPVDAMRAD